MKHNQSAKLFVTPIWNCYFFYLLMLFVEVWIAYSGLFFDFEHTVKSVFCVPKFIYKNPIINSLSKILKIVV